MEVELYKMKYKIEKKINKLRILGEVFVKNNRNKGSLIINNKKNPLKDIIIIDYIKEYKIQMILSKNIYNKSFMFKNCNFLETISFSSIFEKIEKSQNEIDSADNEDTLNKKEIKSKNTKIGTDESSWFYPEINDSILTSEISYANEESLDNSTILHYNNKLKYLKENYSIFKELFSGCESLKSLPDISKWDTNNVINMSSMFYNCKSLLSLPDISKRDTNNVINMSSMFHNCKLLKSLPDISNWNMNNVMNISNMFSNCESLSFLPDISKWNTKNIGDFSHIFSSCSNLFFLPNISKWNTKMQLI